MVRTYLKLNSFTVGNYQRTRKTHAGHAFLSLQETEQHFKVLNGKKMIVYEWSNEVNPREGHFKRGKVEVMFDQIKNVNMIDLQDAGTEVILELKDAPKVYQGDQYYDVTKKKRGGCSWAQGNKDIDLLEAVAKFRFHVVKIINPFKKVQKEMICLFHEATRPQVAPTLIRSSLPPLAEQLFPSLLSQEQVFRENLPLRQNKAGIPPLRASSKSTWVTVSGGTIHRSTGSTQEGKTISTAKAPYQETLARSNGALTSAGSWRKNAEKENLPHAENFADAPRPQYGGRFLSSKSPQPHLQLQRLKQTAKLSEIASPKRHAYTSTAGRRAHTSSSDRFGFASTRMNSSSTSYLLEETGKKGAYSGSALLPSASATSKGRPVPRKQGRNQELQLGDTRPDAAALAVSPLRYPRRPTACSPSPRVYLHFLSNIVSPVRAEPGTIRLKSPRPGKRSVAAGLTDSNDTLLEDTRPGPLSPRVREHRDRRQDDQRNFSEQRRQSNQVEPLSPRNGAGDLTENSSDRLELSQMRDHQLRAYLGDLSTSSLKTHLDARGLSHIGGKMELIESIVQDIALEREKFQRKRAPSMQLPDEPRDKVSRSTEELVLPSGLTSPLSARQGNGVGYFHDPFTSTARGDSGTSELKGSLKTPIRSSTSRASPYFTKDQLQDTLDFSSAFPEMLTPSNDSVFPNRDDALDFTSLEGLESPGLVYGATPTPMRPVKPLRMEMSQLRAQDDILPEVSPLVNTKAAQAQTSPSASLPLEFAMPPPPGQATTADTSALDTFDLEVKANSISGQYDKMQVVRGPFSKLVANHLAVAHGTSVWLPSSVREHCVLLLPKKDLKVSLRKHKQLFVPSSTDSDQKQKSAMCRPVCFVCQGAAETFALNSRNPIYTWLRCDLSFNAKSIAKENLDREKGGILEPDDHALMRICQSGHITLLYLERKDSDLPDKESSECQTM